jgi:hypothetical protein
MQLSMTDRRSRPKRGRQRSLRPAGPEEFGLVFNTLKQSFAHLVPDPLTPDVAWACVAIGQKGRVSGFRVAAALNEILRRRAGANRLDGWECLYRLLRAKLKGVRFEEAPGQTAGGDGGRRK